MSVFSRPIFCNGSPYKALSFAYKRLDVVRHSSGGPHFVKHDVENYSHNLKIGLKKAPKIADFWKKVFFIVMVPSMIASAYYSYQHYLEEIEHLKHRKQEDYIPYPYLAKRAHPFPWGDGNKSFFHNPYTNWVPGVGYEKLMSEEEKGKK
uniref:Cytochrome c oxidase polypeptide VIa n=1 Tax=Meloidogyne incognita TaxID=6306 RepID=A0A914L9F3_MELIC